MYEKQNNKSIEIDNTKETEGYLYLIQPDINQPIFKIGGSQAIGLTRIKSYGKLCKVFSLKRVINTWITEKKLIKCFNEKFTRVQGREYFTGCLGEMLVIFEKICVDNLPDYSNLNSQDIRKEKEIKVEDKPVRGRGRPKKIEAIKGLSGDNLLNKLEEMGQKENELELLRAKRYKERLEERKKMRQEQAKPRGRPRKEKIEPQQQEPKKPKIRQITKEFNPNQIENGFNAYMTRVFDIKQSDLKLTDKSVISLLTGQLINIIKNNSNITEEELKRVYKEAKSKYSSIFSYHLFLYCVVFGLYINSGLTGNRIVATENKNRQRQDFRDIRPEFNDFLKGDYPKTKKKFWAVFSYLRVKTGTWTQSLNML